MGRFSVEVISPLRRWFGSASDHIEVLAAQWLYWEPWRLPSAELACYEMLA